MVLEPVSPTPGPLALPQESFEFIFFPQSLVWAFRGLLTSFCSVFVGLFSRLLETSCILFSSFFCSFLL